MNVTILYKVITPLSHPLFFFLFSFFPFFQRVSLQRAILTTTFPKKGKKEKRKKNNESS
jgi:hypothetical protein